MNEGFRPLFFVNYIKVNLDLTYMKKSVKISEWILRLGVFGSFLGHGVFALGLKQSWVPLITVVGFSESTALALLPVIGTVDLVVAFLVLFWPIRVVLIYAAVWGFATALVRPLAGDPIWDFVERSANWAAPFALLALQGFPRKVKDFFTVR